MHAYNTPSTPHAPASLMDAMTEYAAATELLLLLQSPPLLPPREEEDAASATASSGDSGCAADAAAVALPLPEAPPESGAAMALIRCVRVCKTRGTVGGTKACVRACQHRERRHSSVLAHPPLLQKGLLTWRARRVTASASAAATAGMSATEGAARTAASTRPTSSVARESASPTPPALRAAATAPPACCVPSCKGAQGRRAGEQVVLQGSCG
jgi:hypothetical protein